ncbi:hypothetical protein JB92DRAFT_3098645 [Gautieria morchelliformis]|nr:hypothetical protein JB92DRAFT_3098645 [Gautieria morchelliformis]
MSAHSFPSLISDSSSLSRKSDIHQLTRERLSIASLNTKPPSILLPPRDTFPQPENTEVLRSRVSKHEQDRFVLGDYAAEFRVRQLERERMEHQAPINDSDSLKLVGNAESNPSAVLPTSLSRRNSPTQNTYHIAPNRSSRHRPSSSLSAATSTSAKRVLSRSSSHGTPSPTSSQLAFPSTSKAKVVPKRNSCLEVPETIAPPQPDPSASQRHCEYEAMTPTRRRLQAMSGLFSSESLPSLGDIEPIQTRLHSHEHNDTHRAHSVHIPYAEGSSKDTVCDQGTKRPTFTSKLDSIILTSKLFPLSSSRSKTPLSPVDHRVQTSHTAVIPLVRPTPSSTPHAGNISLNSPPHKSLKVQLPKKGHNLLSQSLGLEENRYTNVDSISTDRKLAPRSRGRVSFSERLFSPPDRGDETYTGMDRTGGLWGSWGRKRQPPPLSSTKANSPSSPPSSPLSAFSSRFSRSYGEQPANNDDQRWGKRSSLAPGCLKTLVSGVSDRDRAPIEGPHGRYVLRRSHSESRRPTLVSRTHSGRSTITSRRSEDGEHGTNVRSKEDKKRITPSRVGSPMPKSRLPELQGGSELERTSSMRSAGKWGHRGRGFSAELTRRRTIHPMFSFERPGSTEAASMSSSRRGERAHDEATSDGRRGKSNQLPQAVTSASPPPARLPLHECDAAQSIAIHAQDHSQTSGNTGGTGVTREPGHAGKIRMMRTRLGMQSHGTFAFEPAAAVVCSPRPGPPAETDHNRGPNLTGGSLSKRKGIALVRSLSISDTRGAGQAPLKPDDRAIDVATRELEYLEFCKEMKAVLGDDWSSFKKYVRRFDLEALSAEVLVQRVKKLLDGRRSLDSATRLRLYQRFVKAVHDNMQE